MRNLADAIEKFIIGELLQDNDNTILVQRNELAERLSCAPSQISYVLSTRFTPEKGFIVESRRGSGGFVRIVRMNGKNIFSKNQVTASDMLHHFAEESIITSREESILQFMFNILDVDDAKKKEILKNVLLHLSSKKR